MFIAVVRDLPLVYWLTVMTTISKQTFNIGGIAVNVFALPGATAPSAPVAVLFLLHGRTGKAENVAPNAESTLQWTDKHRKDAGVQGHDLIIVTLVGRVHYGLKGTKKDAARS